jgi:thiol-disulfide isomerase/thioredoxin
VHKIGALLLLILLIIIIIFIGFEDQKTDTSPIPVEDTTEILTKKNSVEEDNRFKIKKPHDALLDTSSVTDLSTSQAEKSVVQKKPVTFTLTNTKTESHNVIVSDKKVIFQNTTEPIFIVNFFATWCPPCTGQIPYLNDLQKKYKTDLFVIGILTHDTIVQSELETFMAKNQVNYFISNGVNNDAFANLLAYTLHLPNNFSIPLTVMYVKGEYFTHYEGSVPVEMIEYDIQEAKKQLKSR